MKDLSLRPKIVKILEENIGKILLDVVLGSDFFLRYDIKNTGSKSKN